MDAIWAPRVVVLIKVCNCQSIKFNPWDLFILIYGMVHIEESVVSSICTIISYWLKFFHLPQFQMTHLCNNGASASWIYKIFKWYKLVSRLRKVCLQLMFVTKVGRIQNLNPEFVYKDTNHTTIVSLGFNHAEGRGSQTWHKTIEENCMVVPYVFQWQSQVGHAILISTLTTYSNPPIRHWPCMESYWEEECS